MIKPNEKIEVAKITSRQAILVAAITAFAGLAAGYFGKPSASSETTTRIPAMEAKVQSLERDLQTANASLTQTRYDLATLKQRVRDILGPKDDAIKRMSQSLERMRGQLGPSDEHRERLAEIVQQLNTIDNKVLGIVE